MLIFYKLFFMYSSRYRKEMNLNTFIIILHTLQISSLYSRCHLPPFCLSDEEAEQSGRGLEPESRLSRAFAEDDQEEDSEFILSDCTLFSHSVPASVILLHSETPLRTCVYIKGVSCICRRREARSR